VPLDPLPVRTTPPSFLGNDVRSLAFSPDERTLAAVANGVLSLWAVPDGRPFPALPGEAKYGGAITFSADGRVLAAGLRDGTIEMWGIPDGQLLGRLEGHSGPVECLAWAGDGSVLASGGQDREVRLWRAPDGRAPDVLGGHDAPVTHLAIDPGGRVLASADEDGTVELWGLPGGGWRRTLLGGGRIHGLAVTPDGSLLAGGGADGTVRLWASELFPLVRIPAGRMGLEDVGRVHAALADAAMKDAERAALEFIAALVRWRRRFDVHLDDAPQRIAVGEFDIEIAG
jgi:WD40 repeat protein